MRPHGACLSAGRALPARLRLRFSFSLLCLSSACDGGGVSVRDGGTHAGVKHDHDPAQAEDAGGDGDAGMAIGPRDDGTCDVPQHCKPLSDPCQAAVCLNHVCHEARLPAGTAVAAQMAGDCTHLTCDANGKIEALVDPSDLPADDDDPCTVAACQGQTPKQVLAPAGTLLSAEAQVVGDCKSLSCDAKGQVVVGVQTSDLPLPGDRCQVPACDGPNPSSTPSAQGITCSKNSVCDGHGKCIACTADHATCSEDWQCCGGVCGADKTCVATVCRAGASFCHDQWLAQCAADGLSFQDVQDCADTKHCDDVTGSCLSFLCTPGLPSCNHDIATTCNESGDAFEPGGTDCKASHQVCANGACSGDTRTDSVDITTLQDMEIAGPHTRVNGFTVTGARTLLELEVYLKLSTATQLTFVVYEGASDGKTAALIKQEVVSAQAGTGYYSSGALSIPLRANHLYALGVAWSGAATPTVAASVDTQLSFGSYLGKQALTSIAPANIDTYYDAGFNGLFDDWTDGLSGQRIHTGP